ncbi:hypothetical protein [[Eubacterium] hominis]
MKEDVVSYILPDNDEIKALRFDALLYGIELAYITRKNIKGQEKT